MYSLNRHTTIRLCILLVCLLLLGANFAYADASASVRVINIPGGGTVTVTVKNKNGTTSSDGIVRWTGLSTTVGSWQVADQHLEIVHSGLPQGWGIQIYTDNKNGSPAYTGYGDPAGLVKVSNPLVALPMAWRITDKPPSGYVTGDPDNPYNPANVVERADHSGMTSYLWHFMKDRNTPEDPTTTDPEAFVEGDDYITLWSQQGIAWNEGGRHHNPKKAYIYFAARLTTSPVGVEYKTTTLTIEAFHGISPFPFYIYLDGPKVSYGGQDHREDRDATLENHYAPSGWLNYKDYSGTPEMLEVDSWCRFTTEMITPPPGTTGTYCLKMVWDGRAGKDNSKWTGVVWLEPEDIWDYEPQQRHPTHNGYDLRGADYLSFWARTNSDNVNMQIKTYFGNDFPGTAYDDSCGQTPPVWRTPTLTTGWQQYIIPVLGRDMSRVTGGLAIIVDKDHDPQPDGCTVYIDDVKFDKY